MMPVTHAVTSGVISVFVGLYFKSPGCAVVSFITGVFIDLDHLFDYYTSHRFTLSLKRIYCACVRIRFKRLFILLHSYELIAVLWIAIYVFSLSNMWKAAAIGLTQHIILDQITNPISAFGYFLTYRILNRFGRDRIVRMAAAMEGRKCRR
jgi:hypothetical protein